MAGLVPAIYVFLLCALKNVDAPDKPGHDGDVLRNAHSIFRASSGSMIGMPSRIG
jgi:hypothetical protein